MTYTATWTNSNAQGRLEACTHAIRLSDPQELAAAINRRRRLTYQASQDFSAQVYSGAYVRRSVVAGSTSPPFDDFRSALSDKLLDPPVGTMGGEPPSPTAMQWLWPLADQDEDKIIVSGSGGVGSGQVGLFQRLNGTSHWTDASLPAGRANVRAVHFNELRQAAEWLRRGRWTLPVYFPCGLFSLLPDASWIGQAIANNGTDELRSVGLATISGLNEQNEIVGLDNVAVRAASRLEITADADCTVAAYRCLRSVEFVGNTPTWNEYDPASCLSWAQGGGLGSGDSTLIDSVALQAGLAGTVSGANLAGALQAMVEGAPQNFLLRRSDAGGQTIAVSAQLIVEFDLASPPN